MKAFSESTHGLRGLASMAVFLGHVAGGLGLHVYASDPALAAIGERLATWGAFGVEIFFVISGFVIMPSVLRYAPAAFAERRFWRLYPTFLFFTLLYFVANRIVGLDPTRDDLRSLANNLLFLDHLLGTPALTPNAWSITFEVWYYAIACGLAWLVRRTAGRSGEIAARVLAGAVVGAYVAWQPISLYFLGGVVVFALARRDRAWCPDALFVPLELANGLAWLVLVTGFAHPGAALGDPLHWARVASTTLLFALILDDRSLTRSFLQSRALLHLGTVSYSLYLLHPYVVRAVREVAIRTEAASVEAALFVPLFYATVVVVTLAATQVVHRVIELGPYRLRFGDAIYRGARN